MEFSTGDIVALLGNKETVVVGFALIFLGWAMLERRDRKTAEGRLEKAQADNIETYKLLTTIVQKFDDNTTFWRDTIMRLTDRSVRLSEERRRPANED